MRPFRLTFHVEATDKVSELIERVKAKGMRVGIALKPATPVEVGRCGNLTLVFLERGSFGTSLPDDRAGGFLSLFPFFSFFRGGGGGGGSIVFSFSTSERFFFSFSFL